MKNEDYVDLIYYQIIKAESIPKLKYLEDDIEISSCLGNINKNDRRYLVLALQNRFTYLFFSEVIKELENNTNARKNYNRVYQREMKKVNKKYLTLLDGGRK